MGSATAAAAGEQQDDEDDPDPVVVVEYVAQTVVHSEPPVNMKLEGDDPVSTIIICRRAEDVRGILKFSSQPVGGFPEKFANTP